MALTREPHAEPLPGYFLLEPLGSGGFGEVWKCTAPGGLLKAIKFVFGRLNASEQESHRAEQELRSLEKVKNIRHPFILTIEQVHDIDGELLIVMELADKDLRDVFNDYRQRNQVGIPRQELLSYMRDAAEALDLMQSQNSLQHLDIKPSNLFVVSNRVKVADFGLAQALENRTQGDEGLLGGITPAYAAPETFQANLSPFCDQYSLAIVFQELLTGSLPFKGKTARALMQQHLRNDPDLSPVPMHDRAIIARALSKDPVQRFPTCMDFVGALIRATPGARTWQTMEDLFFDNEEDEKSAVQEARRSGLRKLESDPARHGPLRPTLLIGLGEYGKEALQALRLRIIDRFGALEKLPSWRFLYLDSDPLHLNMSLTGPPEQVFQHAETYHAALQGLGNYRKSRLALELVSDWLSMEKLYNMPRSLAVEGSRALGRLALIENFVRINSRLKKEIQSLVDPTSLERSATMTGLGLGTEVPQIYLFAATGGGTGSGMLIDIAYILRRLLEEQGFANRDIMAFLNCGAPADPATPKTELGNTYSLLTEIQHFSDPHMEFRATYKPGSQPLTDGGPPFTSVYLSRAGRRGPSLTREIASRQASLVFHELSSPLGRSLLAPRRKQLANIGTVFRSFGVYNVWYPRGLMLRIASRQACQRLIRNWLNMDAISRMDEITSLCDKLVSDESWQPDPIAMKIERRAAKHKEGAPVESIETFISNIHSQVNGQFARLEPATWCHDVLQRLRELVGTHGSARQENVDWHRSKLNRIYSEASMKVVDEYSDFLTQPARAIFDKPGGRVSAAEAAYQSLGHRFKTISDNLNEQMRMKQFEAEESSKQVTLALNACLDGSKSFSLFPARKMQKLQLHYVDCVTKFCRKRLAEQTLRAVENVFQQLSGKLLDLQRDLSFCTGRLRQVEAALMTAEDHPGLTSANIEKISRDGNLSSAQMSSSHILRDAAMVLASRIVLPEGETDLERAASRFLATVPESALPELDQYLQSQVLTPRGGLFQLCMTNSELGRTLCGPLVQTCAEYLDRFLEVADVCSAELSTAETLGVDLAAQTKVFHHMSTPSIVSKDSANVDQAYLVIPDSEAGKKFVQEALQTLQHTRVIDIGVSTDILICREQGNLTLNDLQGTFQFCKDAYQSLCNTPSTTCHNRTDILDWIPLEP